MWLHGSNSKFENWQFPPPQKDRLTVSHTALFFTKNMDYAKSNGQNLAKVAISPSARVLDTQSDMTSSENLRARMKQLHFPSLLLNTESKFWHAGWKSGDVLRIVPTVQAVEVLENQIQQTQFAYKCKRNSAEIFVYQNVTRTFIDEICQQARVLGFDAISGHEVDRHSSPPQVLAQSWLAVMNADAISAPEWIAT